MHELVEVKRVFVLLSLGIVMQETAVKLVQILERLNALNFNVLAGAFFENSIEVLINSANSQLGLEVPLSIQLRSLHKALSLIIIGFQDDAISGDFTPILELQDISNLKVLQAGDFETRIVGVNLRNFGSLATLTAESGSRNSVSFVVFAVSLALSE